LDRPLACRKRPSSPITLRNIAALYGLQFVSKSDGRVVPPGRERLNPPIIL
jgi:hypothetical protein